jgi:hypothetical protein
LVNLYGCRQKSALVKTKKKIKIKSKPSVVRTDALPGGNRALYRCGAAAIESMVMKTVFDRFLVFFSVIQYLLKHFKIIIKNPMR